jgi:hypothetical protein
LRHNNVVPLLEVCSVYNMVCICKHPKCRSSMILQATRCILFPPSPNGVH